MGILVASTVIRIGFTMVVGIGSSLNLKEKVFAALALMSKATVQVNFKAIFQATFLSDIF